MNAVPDHHVHAELRSKIYGKADRAIPCKVARVIMQVQCGIPAPPQFSMKPIADHHDSAFGAADKPSRSISLLTMRLTDRHITASTPILVQCWEALCTVLASIELNGSLQHVMHSVRSSAQADA